VSHAPERTEKDCLNCGAVVIGRFCHICGQENIVPKESFWKLVTHFFYDITHFDSNFFHTLQYLLFRPGFLSKEYIKGKRASYLNPVRMYVFTSAIFFLVFFLIVSPDNIIKWDTNTPITPKKRAHLLADLETEYKKGEKDTTVLLRQIRLLKDTARVVTNADLVRVTSHYKSFAEYDSLQKKLPPSQRDGWFSRMMVKKFESDNSFQENPGQVTKQWTELFLHKLPYLLFISLPVFALILKLLYVRRKQFFYADHAIFSIHHYILSFILLLFAFLLDTLFDMTGLQVFEILLIVLLFVWPVHLYIAMLNFYKQGWFKTLVKFSLLNILGFLALLTLFVIFFIATIFFL
jgi:hypothetical protein